MAALDIIEISSPKDLSKFVKFPMDLYRGNSCFVPPLINDELKIWDTTNNGAFLYCEAKKYLALKDGKVVGRIAVIYNKKEAEELGISKIRFGWLDFIDDLTVSRALIEKALEFAKIKNISKIEGPMGFTNLDKSGMLTMGFDKLATMIGLYNFPYYPEHLEKLGLVKEKEWVEFEMDFPKTLSEKVLKFNNLIKQKYKLRTLEFKNKDEIKPYIDPMFKLLDHTYNTLSTYTPISPEQIQTYKEKYFPFIDKNFIVCVVDEQDELVAFAVTMPSYSKALQKANGSLWPFGWYHLLRATKKNDSANFYLIGILPEYQRRGVTAIIFKEIYDRFSKMGINYAETNPELEENTNVQVLWQDYNPTNHKRRRTYSKEI